MRALGDDRFEAYSAGAKPSSVHPLAIRVLTEIGVDVSNHRSKSVEKSVGKEFDYIITLCGEKAKDVCPVFIGKAKQRLHWNFIDPAEAVGNDEEALAVFRKVREEIKTNIEEFVKESKELS